MRTFFVRSWEEEHGESAPFMVWNRNKRSIELDLRDPDDKWRLLDLVDGADILIENFRPGTLGKLGLDYEVLKERNPRLVYAAISGFGQTGPYSARGGFDLMTQGMSGLMSTCGPADGPPHRLPIAISDVAAGMFLAFGILAAIEARHRTGRGQIVRDVAAGSCGLLRRLRSRALFGSRDAASAHRPGAPRQLALSGPLCGGRLPDDRCFAAELLGAFHLYHRSPRAARRRSFQVERRPRALQHGAHRHHRERTCL